MDALSWLNELPEPEARAEFFRCCGSPMWAQMMAGSRPFQDEEHLYGVAQEMWEDLSDNDRREAFSQHPRIGDRDALRKKFATTAAWATGEQAKVAEASDAVLDALAKGNKDYEEKFGYIFIVCATGKSAEEMLEILNKRLSNDPLTELHEAAAEQAAITKLRLEKLLKSHER